MKRSRVNQILREGEAFIRSFGVALPPFANWTPERFSSADARIHIERRLGWDITDYGQGRFDEMGLFLFTLRNGSIADLQSGKGMLYAEKLLVSREQQLSPMHRHFSKTEDIINRGGGQLVIELFGSDTEGGIDDSAGLTVIFDGVQQELAPGARVALAPGASITLKPGDWHAFWAEGGDVLIGEVSTVNDDLHDNAFVDDIGRFSTIEEDAPPYRLLVSDYDQLDGRQ